MDVDAREMEKDHRAHETVVSSAVETIFRGIASITPHQAKAVARKANRASQGPRVCWQRKEGDGQIQREIQRFQECQMFA